MRRTLPNRSLAATAALAALLLACEDRMAGTSTSVGTGLGGQVVASDGTLVPGARVVARAAHVEYREGVPVFRALDSTVTDRRGEFHLPGLMSGAFHLDIEGPDPASFAAQASGTGAERYLAYYGSVPEGRRLGTLGLKPPGTVKGRVKVPYTEDRVWAWLGVEGGGTFLPLRRPADWPVGVPMEFELTGVAPGERKVAAFYLPDSTGAKIDPVEERVTVKSGEAMDLGLLGD